MNSDSAYSLSESLSSEYSQSSYLTESYVTSLEETSDSISPQSLYDVVSKIYRHTREVSDGTNRKVSHRILTRPSVANLGKRTDVLAKTEWTSKILKTHPHVKNLRERLHPLYRAISFAETYKGREKVSHDMILELIMQYLEFEGLNPSLRALEKESRYYMDSREIQDCRLYSLLSLVLKDVENIWEISMDKGNPEEKSSNMELLSDILQTFNVSKEIDTLPDDVNIWDEPSYNIIYEEDDSNSIMHASLNKLIENLTPSKNVDLSFVQTFLTTYTLFTTPDLLFKKLKQRYNYPNFEHASDQEYRKKVLPIQVRVINVIKQWTEEHKEDFTEPLIEKLKDFLCTVVKKNHPRQALALADSIDKYFYSYTPPHDFDYGAKAPKPIVPKNIFSESLTWEDIDDEELARQFTLIEFDYYRQIKSSELLKQSWMKPKLRHKSPNVSNIILRFNEVSQWVSSVIVTATKLKHRVKILTKLINIADHLKRLNNFSTLMSFVAVFNSASITRLRQTFNELSPKTEETLKDVIRTMSTQYGYKLYRRILEYITPPCIPFLGLFLTDLVFIDESSENVVDGLINFRKCCRIHNTIVKLKLFQQTGYNLQYVYQIQLFLKNLAPLIDEKDIYTLSCKIEP